tara:strand:+ start:207 stop:638 length:432 start_codon:yes stop_codon:yes gene_type:complete
MKLDFGCGKKKRAGFFGIDQFPGDDVDKVCDLNKKLPFKENSVDEAYTSHVLEHVDSLEFTMEEIYRVCKPNSKLTIKVPHFSGKSGFFEFHKRFFRYDSFQDFEQKEDDMFTSSKVRLRVYKRKLLFLKKWYYPLNYLLGPY